MYKQITLTNSPNSNRVLHYITSKSSNFCIVGQLLQKYLICSKTATAMHHTDGIEHFKSTAAMGKFLCSQIIIIII